MFNQIQFKIVVFVFAFIIGASHSVIFAGKAPIKAAKSPVHTVPIPAVSTKSLPASLNPLKKLTVVKLTGPTNNEFQFQLRAAKFGEVVLRFDGGRTVNITVLRNTFPSTPKIVVVDFKKDVPVNVHQGDTILFQTGTDQQSLIRLNSATESLYPQRVTPYDFTVSQPSDGRAYGSALTKALKKFLEKNPQITGLNVTDIDVRNWRGATSWTITLLQNGVKKKATVFMQGSGLRFRINDLMIRP